MKKKSVFGDEVANKREVCRPYLSDRFAFTPGMLFAAEVIGVRIVYYCRECEVWRFQRSAMLHFSLEETKKQNCTECAFEWSVYSVWQKWIILCPSELSLIGTSLKPGNVNHSQPNNPVVLHEVNKFFLSSHPKCL